MRSRNPLIIASLVVLPLVAFADKTPPAPLDYQTPVYPVELEDSGEDGTAKITFTVSKKGLVEDPVITSASQPAFGEAALASIKQWRFRPGTEDGVPIDMKVTLPFQFTASSDNKLNAALGRKVFITIDEEVVDSRKLNREPTAIKKVRPVYPKELEGSGEQERVTLNVVIGPDGMVYNPQIESIEIEAFAVPALVAAANWVFEPPTVRGDPVYTNFEMTVWVYEGDSPAGADLP